MTFNRYGTMIVFVLYLIGMASTLVVFISLFDSVVLSASFWISLAAVVLAETALWRYIHYWLRNVDTVKRVIPGYLALGVVILAYLAAVLSYSLFTGIADLALRWYILIHILTFIFAIVVGGLILLFTKFTKVHEQDTQSQMIELQVIESALKQLYSKIRSQDAPENKKIESIITDLIEDVRYSDPVAIHSISYINHQLLHSIQSLEEEVKWMLAVDKQLSIEMVVQRLQDFKQLLIQRNEQLLTSK